MHLIRQKAQSWQSRLVSVKQTVQRVKRVRSIALYINILHNAPDILAMQADSGFD
jgi:hypothetical protein